MYSSPPIDVSYLFVDPAMFDSFESFRSAGFEVKTRSSANKIMVGRHPSTAGYLFKKRANHVSLDEQLTNYEHRLEGARRLKTFIAQHRLQRVAVPQKWLHQLPQSFSARLGTPLPSHVLVVERFEVLDKDEVARGYRHLSEAALRELCVVLFEFRGLDSSIRNMPLVEDGRIAFIDTEKWSTPRERYLGKIRDRLSKKQLSFVDDVFRELKESTVPR